MLRSSILAGVALVLVACTPATDPSQAGRIAASISDGATGGNRHFYWLPPLVAVPSPTGAFDATLSPIVTITEGAAGVEIARFTMTTGQGSETVRVDAAAEQYVVDWRTSQFSLNAHITYRIHVLVNQVELGHADVGVVPSDRELENVDTQQEIALLAGRTLPIRFRIELGATETICGLVVGPDGQPDPTPRAVRIAWLDRPNGTQILSTRTSSSAGTGTFCFGDPEAPLDFLLVYLDNEPVVGNTITHGAQSRLAEAPLVLAEGRVNVRGTVLSSELRGLARSRVGDDDVLFEGDFGSAMTFTTLHIERGAKLLQDVPLTIRGALLIDDQGSDETAAAASGSLR